MELCEEQTPGEIRVSGIPDGPSPSIPIQTSGPPPPTASPLSCAAYSPPPASPRQERLLACSQGPQITLLLGIPAVALHLPLRFVPRKISAAPEAPSYSGLEMY